MSKPGHNSRAAGPVDPVKLKSYVERIEAVESEEADYKAAKKDIYVEVKAAGMRPKMVRRIVKERKKTEADAEDEAELELYRTALAMPGATYRSVSAQTGIPKSTLQRLVPRNKNGTAQPQDGDDGITGEADDEGRGATAGDCRADKRATGEPGKAEHAVLAGRPAGDNEGCPEVRIEAGIPVSVGAVAAEPRVASSFLGDDPGDPPPFLRGSRQGRGA